MIKLEKKRTPAASLPKSGQVWYPSLDILDITEELPITDEMIGDEIDARVKLKVKRVSKFLNSEPKKETYSYEFDVLAIDFE
ncbi:MAG TPA: hypothetical protein ENN27_01280 [Candidatus Atribacteria bacterium]|nr:hypothetical protein [Candidatus Atribacteria bacterium]